MSSPSLEAFAARKLSSLERRRLRRQLAITDRIEGVSVERNGRRLVSFSCNDYLGLANDPQTKAASIAVTTRLGTGAGASRLVTGSHSLHTDLERRLARIKDTEDAVVFGSGYLANIGIIATLAGTPDLILVDELAHSCILAGSRLSGARVIPFAHNDPEAVERELASHRGDHRHCLLLTEGVFSMDGDLAPLPALARLADRFDAWLMTDDAHGFGVVGGGRGSGFAHPEPVEAPLQMGTLSKAAGAYGGYLCASHGVAELIRNRAPSFVYSTGLPPGTIAAAAEALRIIESDAARVARPLELARRFTRELGLPEAQSAIVPIVIGDTGATLEAGAALESSGYLVVPIRPPTVPPGTSRLRFTFSAGHTNEQVAGLIDAVLALGLTRTRASA